MNTRVNEDSIHVACHSIPYLHYPNLHKQVTPDSCVIAGIGQDSSALAHGLAGRKYSARVGCDENALERERLE